MSWSYDGDGFHPEEYYFEDDCRVVDVPERIYYKPTSRPTLRHTGGEVFHAAIDDDYDDEIDYIGTSASRGYSRYNPYTGRGGRSRASVSGRGRRAGFNSSVTNSSGHGQKLTPGNYFWYKIMIPHGGKYTKEYLLEKLTNFIAPTPLSAMAYTLDGQHSYFYVEDFQTANELYNADKKILLTTGYKLNLLIQPIAAKVRLPAVTKGVVKKELAKRYSTATNTLDLSYLFTDPDLRQYAFRLQRPPVLGAVLQLVAENFPGVSALNLSGNRISTPEALSVIVRRLPSLTVLNLSKNEIHTITDLDALTELCLVELVLLGNPVCDHFNDSSVYISEIKKRFPNLIKVDVTNLCPPVLSEVVKVPPAKALFSCCEERQPLVRAFLEQYYGVYDMESRLPLADAYHESALLSLTAVYQPGQNASNSPLSVYLGSSRNLLNVWDMERRRKLLRRGRQAVSSTLTDLPRTEHDAQSFTFDLLISTPEKMAVSVTGVYREPSSSKPLPVRSFSRIMVIVPYGVGLCITNDVLYITNATPQQLKAAFQQPKPPDVATTDGTGKQ